MCDSCQGFNWMVFCFASLSSYIFKSIIAPISNQLCLYVRLRQHRYICLREAHKDPERLIVGTEMRSRPYLGLVESQPYFIISWFHALGSPANLLNLQGPWCREALIHAEDVRGQDARKSENGTYLCNFLRLCLLLYFITAAHFLNRQPENYLHLLVAPFKPHYLKTTWHFKGSIQIKVSLLMVVFRPSIMSHQQNQQSLTASVKLVRFPFCAAMKVLFEVGRQFSEDNRRHVGADFRRLACSSLHTWTMCGAALC